MKWRIIQGDALEVLRTLPAGSVHCVVTSPPYFGLRSYGTEPVIRGGDPLHEHTFVDRRYYVEGGGGAGSSGEAFSRPGPENAERIKEARWRVDGFCTCGAWRGHVGLEPTLAEYVAGMVEIFREVRRVLRADGTCWVNLGDSYSNDRSWGGKSGRKNYTSDAGGYPRTKVAAGLGNKQLMGVPWRVAFALQDDGWYLRSDIIWAKPNPMPESVTDRPTKAHEYLFLLSKKERYYYDQEAIRETLAESSFSDSRLWQEGYKTGRPERGFPGQPSNGSGFLQPNPNGRNARTVWQIATQPCAEAHFATFPEELPRRAILAGTSEHGVCPECGAPWVRIIEKPDMNERPRRGTASKTLQNGDWQGATSAGQAYQEWRNANPDVTTGWQPSCDHDGAPVPATVLDPFSGSGTTAAVALSLGRSAIGIELNPAYIRDIAEPRLRAVLPLLQTAADTGG